MRRMRIALNRRETSRHYGVRSWRRLLDHVYIIGERAAVFNSNIYTQHTHTHTHEPGKVHVCFSLTSSFQGGRSLASKLMRCPTTSRSTCKSQTPTPKAGRKTGSGPVSTTFGSSLCEVPVGRNH